MPIEQNTFKMDTKNFTLPFLLDNGDGAIIYIPQPNSNELMSLAPVLGEIFRRIERDELDYIVFSQDWDIIVKKILRKETEEDASIITRNMESFFERRILDANAFKENGCSVEKLSNDERNQIKGILLFFSALLRYVKQRVFGKESKDLTTSLSVLEYQEWLKKRYAEQQTSAKSKHYQKS